MSARSPQSTKSPQRVQSPQQAQLTASPDRTPARILPPPSARYQGSRMPAAAYDVTAGKDMPTWSTSLFAVCDNPQMILCGLTGIGMCAMHGHVQDALYGNGCCLSCMISLFTLGECGRQRSFFRKRLEMPGGIFCNGYDICPGCSGDFFVALLCFPLSVCQEARELEIRSQRRWTPLMGFRGKGEMAVVAYCGEETLDNVLAAYKPKPKDVLREGMYDNDDEDDEAASEPASPLLLPPVGIDFMTR